MSKEIEQMIHRMSNFYQDHLPMDSSFEKLLKVYTKTIAIVRREYEYARANTVLEEAKTVYTLPYFKLDITDGLYTSSRANSLKLLPFEDQLKEMDRAGEYVTLSFLGNQARIPLVFSMDLKLTFKEQESLSLYTDYFIRENRLYLLPDFILTREKVVKSLHAFDIKIDNKILEKNWGSLFSIEAGPLLPRYQYRDVLSAFQQVLRGNLTIKDITEGIRRATHWDVFKIEDIMTPSLSPAKKRLYDEWMLSPARFIVTLPEELIKDKLRLNIVLSLLDEAKEADKNYMMIFDVPREDILEPLGKHKHSISMSQRDITIPQDSDKKTLSMSTTDFLFPSTGYDTGRHYDFKINYDENTYEGETATMDSDVFMDDIGAVMDVPWINQVEYFEVNHVTFPEIPRQFIASTTLNPDEYEFSCRPNFDGTTAFELYASNDPIQDYTLVEQKPNDEGVEKVTFLHNAKVLGKRYYKVKAIAGDKQSFMTLPVDVEAL